MQVLAVNDGGVEARSYPVSIIVDAMLPEVDMPCFYRFYRWYMADAFEEL